MKIRFLPFFKEFVPEVSAMPMAFNSHQDILSNANDEVFHSHLKKTMKMMHQFYFKQFKQLRDLIQKTAKECELTEQEVSNIISGVSSPVNEMISRVDVDKMVSYDSRTNTLVAPEAQNSVARKRNLKTE